MLNEFVFTKIEEEANTTFGFNRTALRVTQPKLRSMFCALFLKNALSAAELMSFGHLEAAIYLWGAVKETINALKDNIREAIGEIQLHAIDYV